MLRQLRQAAGSFERLAAREVLHLRLYGTAASPSQPQRWGRYGWLAAGAAALACGGGLGVAYTAAGAQELREEGPSAGPAAPVPAWPAAAAAPQPSGDVKEPDLWDKWARVRSFLGGWRSRRPTDVPLPTDKLACHRPPPGVRPADFQPVVLVSCGSFNPPTHMHLRMLDLARQALMKAGMDVLGCYLSPVNDAYWKQTLAPGRHRVAMCQLASQDSESIMVDPWEVEQRQYTRTLFVLRHVEKELRRLVTEGAAPHPAEEGAVCAPVTPRVMLVCGADVLESMADPTLWRQDLLEELLREHGVVCVSRDGTPHLAQLLADPESLLGRYAPNVALLQEPVPNEISSSRVRHELEQGHSVRYLVPDPVIKYITEHGLYGTAAARPRVLHPTAGGAVPQGVPPARRYSPVYVFDPTLGILVDAEDLAAPHPA